MEEYDVKMKNRGGIWVHLLVLLFGSGAWVAVSGVWVELPVLVFQSPEQWALPTNLSVITQLANIGPLFVVLYRAKFPKNYNLKAVIYTLFGIGCLSTLLLSFLWNRNSVIGEKEISLSLYLLYFSLALVDCTSSLTFLPYMRYLQSRFTPTYFIGEGLSGIMPTLVALGQGVGMSKCVAINETNNGTQQFVAVYETPRFSADVFFGVLCAMMLASGCAFLLLNVLKTAKQFHQHQLSEDVRLSALSESTDEGTRLSETPCEDAASELATTRLAKFDYLFFLAAIFWKSLLMNGLYPSISSYASIPYGNTAYHIAAVMRTVSMPIACMIAMILPIRRTLWISLSVAVGSSLGLLLLVLAKQSPCPLLVGTHAGAAVMCLATALFLGFLSYAQANIGAMFRLRCKPQSLFLFGVMEQSGAFTGAITMFAVVTYTKEFTAGDRCTTVCYPT